MHSTQHNKIASNLFLFLFFLKAITTFHPVYNCTTFLLDWLSNFTVSKCPSGDTRTKEKAKQTRSQKQK